MRRSFPQEYQPILYSTRLISVNRACRERMEVMYRAIKERRDVAEKLKAAVQKEWMRRMNSIYGRAKKTVLYSLVYAVYDSIGGPCTHSGRSLVHKFFINAN